MTGTPRHSTLWATALAALTILIANPGAAQDLVLVGDIVNNGTISVNRNVINNAATPVTVGGTGTVLLTGNVGAITAHSIQGNDSISFNRLDMRGSRPTTMAVGVVVWNGLRIGTGGGANAYTAAGVGFSVGAQRLAIATTSTYAATSTAALTFSGGTVQFFGAAAQAVLNKASGVTYGTLDLTGAGAKTFTAGGQLTADTVTHAGGAVSVTENLNVTATATIGSLANISAGKTLGLTAASTGGSISSFSNTLTGTLTNAGAGTLTITTMTGNAGTVSQTGSGIVAFAGDITNTGTITASNGTLDLQGTGTQTNTGGTISLTGTGTLRVSGDLAANPGTLSFAATSTTAFVGAAQNIPTGLTYGDLTAGGTGAKTVANTITVADTVTLDQNITMSAGALTLTSTSATNVLGSAEILGAVRRTHNFAAGQNYRFNRSDVYIGTAATPAADITLTMSPSTDPSGTLPTTGYVKRRYAITPTTAGALQSLQLFYAGAEPQNGVAEAKLGLRSYDGAGWTKVTNPGMSRTAGGGLVTYASLNNSLAGIQEFGLFRIDFVTSGDGANISLAAGWDENAIPDSTDDGVVRHTGVVTGASAVNLRMLTIEAGKDLTTSGASGIVVWDSSLVDGSFNVTNADASTGGLRLRGTSALTLSNGRTLNGTSVINTSTTAMTLSGNLQVSSLTNAPGSSLALNGASNSITGALTNDGSISLTGTVAVASASVQTVTNNGTLTLSGPTALLRVGQSGVASVLQNALSGTITVTNAGGHLQVFGDLQVSGTSTVSNAGLISIGE